MSGFACQGVIYFLNNKPPAISLGAAGSERRKERKNVTSYIQGEEADV